MEGVERVEGLRRLRNHTRGIEWERSRKVMEDWSRKLKRSGYPATMRHEVIKAAVDKYEKMCTEEDDVVEQYNKSLDRLPGVDITDDYVSEKKEVEKLGNKLSYYKWMAKAVLGGKMPKYDHMDEKKGGGGGCCVVS